MKINFFWSSVLIITLTAITAQLYTLSNFDKDVEALFKKNKTPKKHVSLRTLEQREIPWIKTEPPKENEPKFSFPGELETILKKDDNWDIISNPDSALLLVNKYRRLPEGFTPSDLVVPNVLFPFSYFHEKKQLKAVTAKALEEMFEDAQKDGIVLYAISGFRSFERQKEIYHKHIKNKGEELAKKLSAYPGSSEHQTGYAIDVSARSQNFKLTTSFGNSKEGIWVKNNAHKYGFIIRYPKDKTHITEYLYEPWHLRYIGVPHATYIFENNLTLEEAYGRKFDIEIEKPLE